VKFRDLLRRIEDDGWKLDSIRGSHHHYKHPVKSGKVTIAGKPGEDVPPKTLASILKQAGLK
jgi:predicted RNA binding protein YcfA (HicA-like mRNA interferase family)